MENINKIWGPHYWFVIHTYAETYPDEPTQLDKDVATSFIKILPFILPCEECSKHSHEYIKYFYNNIPNIVANKSSLKNFFYIFHDAVNQKLGKPKKYSIL